eukprot:2759801-Pleurochrysis_carterae.AAC.2
MNEPRRTAAISTSSSRDPVAPGAAHARSWWRGVLALAAQAAHDMPLICSTTICDAGGASPSLSERRDEALAASTSSSLATRGL